MTYVERIQALPHVESLEREADGWCCTLRPGLTTEALSGSGVIVDQSIRLVWSFVKGPVLPAQPE
jgi:hypothetical protein